MSLHTLFLEQLQQTSGLSEIELHMLQNQYEDFVRLTPETHHQAMFKQLCVGPMLWLLNTKTNKSNYELMATLVKMEELTSQMCSFLEN